MASRLGTWMADGPAEPGRIRRAAAADALVALSGGVLLWPFPLLRLTLGIPLPVHIALMLTFTGVFGAAASAGAAAVWGRTVGQYRFDLGLEGALPRPFGARRAVAWGIGHAFDVLPAILGARWALDGTHGVAARMASLETVKARQEDRGPTKHDVKGAQ